MDMFYVSSCSTSLNFVSFLKVNSMIRNIIGKIATVLAFLLDLLFKKNINYNLKKEISEYPL